MAKLETVTAASDAAQGRNAWSVRRLFAEWRQLGILLALVATILVFTLLDREFLTSYNLVNIVLQASVTSILAMGVTFVIITGGIDLSIGTALALSAVVCGLLLSQGHALPVVVLGTLATGAFAGLVNGAIITLSRITPFVVTLGSMSIFSGLALIVSGGQTVYGIPPEFSDLVAGRLGPLPTPILIAFAVLVASSVVMKSTKLGEYLIAIGGAREVARLAGIKVGLYTAMAYVISSAFASIGAMVTVGRLGAADPALGADLLLPAIAAAVMGGADLNGGEGSMVGAVIGALLIATLQAGLTFLNVQAFYQQVAIGIVIILALLSNRIQRG
jgi:ribose transport system permease protein